MNEQVKRRGSLVATVENALRSRVLSEEFKPGAKLPSEAELCAEYEVSRTVVREAVATLRAEGLVTSRQGSGIYAAEKGASPVLPFRTMDFERISDVVEMLELRLAIEVECAGLAALRHSPAQIERIIEACDKISSQARAGAPTSEADFAFHLAVAEATNNPRLVQFLDALGINAIPRHLLRPDSSPMTSSSYLQMIEGEHNDIVSAILSKNAEAARAAMRKHLDGAQLRYRNLIRTAPTPS